MTARPPYDPQAGAWVAFLVAPARRYDPATRGYVDAPGTRRIYLYNPVTRTTATSPDLCTRFDTEAEALAAAATNWTTADPVTHLGATRIEQP